MELLWSELTFGIGDSRELGKVLIRVIAAMVFGAAIGIERESAGKAAGVRTHMLVTLGTTVFVLVSVQYGFSTDGLSRVIQGIVTGIGFVGAGSNIKLNDELDVRGLTTSVGIWIAASIGVAIGLGAVGLAAIGTVLALLILSLAKSIDEWIDSARSDKTGKSRTPR